MKLTLLIITLLCLSTVSAYQTSVYSPQTITGDFISQSRSLGYKQRFGECHWEKAKGTVCTWNEEPLPYRQEKRIGNVKVRDLATSVSPWGSQRFSAIQTFGGNFSSFPKRGDYIYLNGYRHDFNQTYIGTYGGPEYIKNPNARYVRFTSSIG